MALGAAVALGTDSRASNPDLSMLAEMRHVARTFPEIAPADVLGLGTAAGAHALGRDTDVGTLEAGKLANLAVVELPSHDAADPHELLFDATLPVVATFYRGGHGLQPAIRDLRFENGAYAPALRAVP